MLDIVTDEEKATATQWVQLTREAERRGSHRSRRNVANAARRLGTDPYDGRFFTSLHC